MRKESLVAALGGLPEGLLRESPGHDLLTLDDFLPKSPPGPPLPPSSLRRPHRSSIGNLGQNPTKFGNRSDPPLNSVGPVKEGLGNGLKD